MLRKLLKYEAKTTARVLLPVGGGVLAFTVITGLVNAILNSQSSLPALVNFFQAALNMIAVLVLVFMMGVCVFVNVQRFYKLLGEQGYLMLSLPVAAWKQIAAKLICACVWSVIGVVYLMVCGCILGGSLGSFPLNLGDRGMFFSPADVAAIFMVALLLLALLAGVYLEFYLACGIGGQFGQQRLLASIIAYFVLGFAEQIIGSFFLIIAAVGAIQMNVPGWASFFYTVDSFWATVYLFAVVLVIVLLIDAVKWAVTQWLMTRRLNLA